MEVNEKREVHPGRLLCCITIGAAIWLSPTPEGLEEKAWQCFAVFAATIVALLIKPMPMGPSVLCGLVVLAAGNVLGETSKESLAAALSGYGDTTTWLVVAAFLLGSAMVRSGLGRRIALGLAVLLGRTVLGLAYAIAAAEFVLGTMIPSNTARGGGVMAPIVNSLSHALGSRADHQPRRAGEYLCLCGAHLNLVAAATFLTGMAANPLIAKETGIDFDWGTWLLGSIVPALVSFLVLPLFLLKLAPPELTDAGDARKQARSALDEMGPWTRTEKTMLGVFVLMVGLWASKPLHGLHTTTVALTGVGILLVAGAEKWKDMKGNAAAWDALIWLGGLISMADALRDLGFISWFAEAMKDEVVGMDPLAALLALVLVYFYSMYGFSMLTGHIKAMVAAFFLVAVGAGAPPMLTVALLAYFSNLCGCLTNYSTGPVVIYFGLGYVESARWFRIGFLVSLLHIAIWLGVGLPWWKFLGWW
ncbi:MAG: DASS family sodium-coupled anion symporter [Verrucomicrobia bacterium]|nr:DASS family sodium-coupled anion symporter [Verrucomicrobiota bacterium]